MRSWLLASQLAFFIVAAAACLDPEPLPPLPATPLPTAEAVDVVGPGLTRSAQDVLRQSRHIATIIASRPTEVSTAGNIGSPASAPPVSVSADGVISPTPVGVWWWRSNAGDFTPGGALRAHPYGAQLDLLDGVLDYHEPLGYYTEVGTYYRDVVSRLFVNEAFRLLTEAGDFHHEPKPADIAEVTDAAVHSLGWEVLDAERPVVRYWGDWRFENAVYRLGGVIQFDVAPWPTDFAHGTPFAEGALPDGFVGSVVLERVE